MKKRLPVILVIAAIIAVAFIFIFTRHTHTFAEATCTTAKTCECGEIEGEPLGHTWTDATCSTAKTCSVCNTTEGTPLEHTWQEATTDTPKTCELCGLTEGEPLSAKQGTVEGYEAETEVETVTEDSGIGTSVELEEDEYQGDNPYDQGTSPSDQQSIEDMAQQLIADYLKDYAQDNQVEVDYPGMTPHDPSQDGQIVIGDNPALAGDYIN